MRQLLRQLGPRYGIGLGLLVAVVIVIAVGKVLPHANTDVGSGVTRSDGGSPVSITSPSPDDGLTSFAPPSPPITSPGADTPQTVATEFATAWLHHDAVSAKAWHDAIVRYCTASLAAQFDEVDPSDVPANRITGALTTSDYASTYVQISIPMDGGTLVLGLKGPTGVWLVDTVDWNRD